MSMLRDVYDKDGNFIRPVTVCGPSLAKQSEADSCDINKIMAKYEKSGVLQHVSDNQPFYADLTNLPDYQAALDIVIKADTLFMSIPAEIRAKFDNDPQKFMDFVSNPDNRDEMIKLGFIEGPEPAPEPIKVEVIAPQAKGA